jgi:hypothetical protein
LSARVTVAGSGFNSAIEDTRAFMRASGVGDMSLILVNP